MCTNPGCDWQWHIESGCTLPNIWYGKYDFIVIQQRAHPFDGAEALIEQGTRLVKEIQAVGAQPVIFAPWSEKNNPNGQVIINDAHKKLHKLCDCTLIADCGTAWHTLRNVINLYADDGEHQNSCGAYLNACILAKTIFGINPLNLPDEIKFQKLSAALTTDEIRLLQKTASML